MCTTSKQTSAREFILDLSYLQSEVRIIVDRTMLSPRFKDLLLDKWACPSGFLSVWCQQIVQFTRILYRNLVYKTSKEPLLFSHNEA